MNEALILLYTFLQELGFAQFLRRAYNRQSDEGCVKMPVLRPYVVGHTDLMWSVTPILSYRGVRYYRIALPDIAVSGCPILSYRTSRYCRIARAKGCYPKKRHKNVRFCASSLPLANLHNQSSEVIPS